MIALFTGGGRSGKSTMAEALALEKSGGGPVLYVATATNTDGEMDERIRLHRARRPENWRTAEQYKGFAGLKLQGEKAVLLDCIGFMLDNIMFEILSDWDAPKQEEADEAERRVKEELSALAALCNAEGVDLMMVTNEVGSGLIPATKVSRLYRDALGRINCHAAALADSVTLAVCGLPVKVK